MLGTLSGLPGHIYLTAMFSLGFSPLYKDKGRGWLGSKRTDPTWRVGVIENTEYQVTWPYTGYKLPLWQCLLLTGTGSDEAVALGRSFQSS